MKKAIVLSGILALSALASAAHAGGDQVDLVDGTSLSGRVTQQTPGSFVVIQTDDGRVQSVPWSQVKRVSTGAASPQPVPAAALSALPPASIGAATPPVAVGALPAAVAPAAPLDADRGPASAAKPLEARFEMGVRLGYAASGGSYSQGYSIGNAASYIGLGGTKGGFPLVVDLGARLNKYVFVGGFAQYAFLTSACFSAGSGITTSCDGHDVRAGLEVFVHARPRAGVDPWVGLGLGHEWLTATTNLSGAGGSATQKLSFDGWDYLDVTAGIDFRAPNGMALGPYLELASGSFDTLNSSVTGVAGGGSTSGAIAGQSSHQWITAGLRGTFEVQ